MAVRLDEAGEQRRPSRSTLRASAPAIARISRSAPTAAMRPSRATSASTCGRRASIVTIEPPK
jgi:hypothetical protein